MALTSSNMMYLGTVAPDFELIDIVSKKVMKYENIAGSKATVLMFICNHCPYVVHIMPEIIKIIKEFKAKGVGFVAISSNDIVAYPQDGPDHMKDFAEKWEMDCPYLFDESQDVARAYDAACTPDFYIFSENNKLIYRVRLVE